MKHRFRQNGILSLNSSMGLVTQVDDINDEIKDHFLDRFTKCRGRRLFIGDVDFKILKEDDCDMLETPFSSEEIKESIWLIDSDKSLGPDNFNMGFYKICWKTINDDLVAFASEFYVTTKLSKSITTFF